jgi:hypothetical protein
MQVGFSREETIRRGPVSPTPNMLLCLLPDPTLLLSGVTLLNACEDTAVVCVCVCAVFRKESELCRAQSIGGGGDYGVEKVR